MYDSAYTGRSTPTRGLILCHHNLHTLNTCMKDFGSKQKSDKSIAMRNWTICPDMSFVYAEMLPSWADHLLPQVSLNYSNTLPAQCKCRRIEHMQEGENVKRNHGTGFSTHPHTHFILSPNFANACLQAC